MGLLHQSYSTGENVPKWVVILRIVLGFSLLLKGVKFISQSSELQSHFADISILKSMPWLISVIPWVHIIGGILIVLGLFTRIASLVQVPILFGAVILVNLKGGLYGGVSELPFSLIVLVLVIVFSFIGGGYLSLDDKFRKPIPTED